MLLLSLELCVCLCHNFLSVHCSIVITCCERADLFALLYMMFSCVFVTFPYGFLCHVWYLILLIADFCLLPYFTYLTLQGGASFVIWVSCLSLSHFLVCSMPAVKGLTSLRSCIRCFRCFVTFPYGFLGQVWYLIVLIADLCLLPYLINWPFQGCASFVDSFFVICVSCLVCHIFLSIHCLLWKGWPLCSLVYDVSYVFATFPNGVLGQMWHLIVLIANLCLLPNNWPFQGGASFVDSFLLFVFCVCLCKSK